jgi:hypothetical protein
MTVTVEHCFNGNRVYFRLTTPDGSRDRIETERWTRQTAAEARDLCAKVYGLERSLIRFHHC